MIQRPAATGLAVCEQVIVEEKTHNITLVNCLTRLRVKAVPSEPQRFIVYAWLTDGLGDGQIRLEVVRPDTLDELLTRDLPATFSDPLQEVRVLFRGSLSFPVEGRYQVRLLADGDIIAQRTVQVFVKKETP